MNRADEKQAFEDMMAEIGESSDEEEIQTNTAYKNINNSNTKNNNRNQSNYNNNSHINNSKNNKSFAAAESKNLKNFSNDSQQQQKNYSFKMSKEEQEIENFGLINNNNLNSNNNQQSNDQQQQIEQKNITKRWLLKPCSSSDRSSMKCFIEREKVGFGLQTIYRCYLENKDGLQNKSTSRFMMAARKKVTNKTSYYLISIDENDFDDRGSENVLGKVRGNTIGSKYLLVDHGVAPDKTFTQSMLRKELGIINFEFDSGGPSQINVFIPSVNNSGFATVFQPTEEKYGLENFVNNSNNNNNNNNFNDNNNGNNKNGNNNNNNNNNNINSKNNNNNNKNNNNNNENNNNNNNVFDDNSNNNNKKVIYLQNKKPKWDEQHGGHVLNFQGRVTESSVKNFQLCILDSDEPEQIILQFGRVSKQKFTMDLLFPLSPFQAFSICVACLDGKIADRKGYEYIKKFTGSSSSNNNANEQKHEMNKQVFFFFMIFFFWKF
jgi:hypothetical protein